MAIDDGLGLTANRMKNYARFQFELSHIASEKKAPNNNK